MEVSPRAAKIAAGLAVGAAGGALCAWIGTPLPWMIGSMLAMAGAQMAGARLELLPLGREGAFVVVGVTLGLYFTAPVLQQVIAHWPWFVALGIAAHGFGTLSALVLARLSGVSRATAYFGSMPGGGGEMAHLGERFGAAPDRVAFAHSFRMVLVVTLFPVGITLAGFSSSEEYHAIALPVDPAGLAMLLAAGVCAGLLAQALRLPTAFMMGPLILAIVLTANGMALSAMPGVLVNAAQVLLGCMLGSRFDRDFLAGAPRFVLSLLASVSVTLVLAVLVGWAIAAGSGAYLGSALLAAAPGGIAEMSITSRVLRLGVAYVTAAHVIRYIIVVLLTVPGYRVLERLRPGHRRC